MTSSRTPVRLLLGAALLAPLALAAPALAGQKFEEPLTWNSPQISGGSGFQWLDGNSLQSRATSPVAQGTFLGNVYCRPADDGTAIRSANVNFYRWHANGNPGTDMRLLDENGATLGSRAETEAGQSILTDKKPIAINRSSLDARCVQAIVIQPNASASSPNGRKWTIEPLTYTFEDIQPPVITKPKISSPVFPPVEVGGRFWYRAQDPRGCEEVERPEVECKVTVDVNWASYDNGYDRGTIGVKVNDGKVFAQDFGDPTDRQHKAGAVPLGPTGSHDVTVYRTSAHSGTAAQEVTVNADGWRPIIKPGTISYTASTHTARVSWSITEKGAGIDRSWAEILINNGERLGVGKVQGSTSSVSISSRLLEGLADGTYPVFIRAVDKVGYRTALRAPALVIARTPAAQQAVAQATKPTPEVVRATGGSSARRANGIVSASFPNSKTKIRVAQARRGVAITGRVTTGGRPEAGSPVAVNLGTRILRARTDSSGAFSVRIRATTPMAIGVMALGGSANTVLNVVK